MSNAPALVAVRGGTGVTGRSGPRASSTISARDTSPASGPWTPCGPRGTLTIPRLSITLGRSASSLAPLSSAPTRRVLPSPALLLESIMSPSESRPRPRTRSAVITRSPRELGTGGERISPGRSTTLVNGRGTTVAVGTMGPLAPRPVGSLVVGVRPGPRWSTGSAPARVRDTLTEAPSLGRRPTPDRLASLWIAEWVERALATAGTALALGSSGPVTRGRVRRRWLARWAGRGLPARVNPPAGAPWAPRRLAGSGLPPAADLPPLRLARWAGPRMGACAPLAAPEGGTTRESPLRLPRSHCWGGLPPGAGFGPRRLLG